mmetsp:Transcript_125637/g.391192  ORF Transcript_125637/g.391192 Transcript_125637/m.391192 type:complete len:205 (-) Transcript_125637:715-1329(-)
MEPLKMHSAASATRFLCCCLLSQPGTMWCMRECRSSCCAPLATITAETSHDAPPPTSDTTAFSRAARAPLWTTRRAYDAPAATSAVRDSTNRASPAFCWKRSCFTSAPSPTKTRQRPLVRLASCGSRLRWVSTTCTLRCGPASTRRRGGKVLVEDPVDTNTTSTWVGAASSSPGFSCGGRHRQAQSSNNAWFSAASLAQPSASR